MLFVAQHLIDRMEVINLECPKCKGTIIIKRKARRLLTPKGDLRTIKEYYCVTCGKEFDIK